MMVAQHVQQRYLAHHGAEQVWPLRERGAHQQSAIAAALDRQMSGVSVLFGDQVLGCGDEVVKNVLLLLQHAVAMPVFAELVSAAQLNVSINAALLQQKQHCIAIEDRRAACIESAIA